LIGHPNVGKSVIFNNLTGLNAIVSNYPGTTVEIYRGTVKRRDYVIDIIDTPGTYSLLPASQAEEVTRRIILEEKPDVIVHVVDATAIRRHLYMSLELMELGIPIVLAVNQIDRAKALGINISRKELENQLGIPVVTCIAVRGEGLEALLDAVIEAHEYGSPTHIKYSDDLEKQLRVIEEVIKEKLPRELKRFSRFIATLLVLGDKEFKGLESIVPASIRKILSEIGKDLILERVTKTDNIYSKVVTITKAKKTKLSRIDYISVRPAFGIAIMAVLTLLVTYGILGLMHEVGHRTPSMLYYNFYEPLVRSVVEKYIPPGIFRSILVGEVSGIYKSMGLLTTGVFFVFFMILPMILVLYFILGVLEDSGFLPRLAVSFHRPLCKMGMTGDAIMPCIAGTGCSIVGVLSTRILRGDKERIIASTLMVLGIPCMAQQVMIWHILGRYGLIYILLLYIILLSIIILVGLILDRVILGGSRTLLIELPPWRKPQLRSVLKKTYTRVLDFLKTGVPLVLLGILIINLAYYTGTINVIAELFSPITSGLWRLPPEVGIAIIIGALRKDVAVGILGRYELSPIQMLTAITVITLSFPCIGSFVIVLSEFGIKRTLKIIAIMFATALTIGSFLGLLSSL